MFVLCIDDDPEDTDFFCEALTAIRPDAKCLIANDGLTALKILRSQTQPDVIFLDINMPRMSGREVLIQIKKNYKWSQLPIIIYATTIHPPDADSYKMLGAQDVLKKHVTFQDLCAALQVVLKKVSVSL